MKLTKPIDNFPTKYWHALENGRIQCDVCPRACKLKEGQRGLCFVRTRENDQIVLATYGRSSGYCIDPVEKKPLNHFLPGTPILSFGTAGYSFTNTAKIFSLTTPGYASARYGSLARKETLSRH